MASYTFTLPGTTKSFTVKGPDGFTEAQAKAIFDLQASAGSLVGVKPGDVLNAASQAAAGLSGAVSQIQQGIAGTTKIINGAIGAVNGAVGQISGQIAGATGAISGAVGQISGQLSSATNLVSGAVLNNSVGQISGQVSQAVNQGVSVAKQAVSTVTNVINSTAVTNGINVADFAKQPSALTSIGNLSVTDVTAGLAQASKLVGQAADKITDALGVGSFGLNAPQLELAGILKPGTAAQFLDTGVNKLTEVLKSPTVFTGKDGIKSLTDLLKSTTAQAGIQQDLMAKGLDGLKQQGIPVDKLSPAALTGTVLNAAKSLTAATDWAKGLPLPAGVKSALDTVSKDAAFAVNLATQKLNDALKQEIVPMPAVDTVNRETLNAAVSRVVGNPKVPAVDFNSKPKQQDAIALDAAIKDYTNNLDKLLDDGILIMSKTDRIRAETFSYSADIRALELLVGDFQALAGQILELIRKSKLLDPPYPAITTKAEALFGKATKAAAVTQSAADSLRKTLASLGY